MANTYAYQLRAHSGRYERPRGKFATVVEAREAGREHAARRNLNPVSDVRVTHMHDN